MTDDLVKALRAGKCWTSEAADRIEALTAERDDAVINRAAWELAAREAALDALAAAGQAQEAYKAQLKAEAKLGKAVEAHQRIVQWADAYPLAVFPEPDFKAVQQALSAAGLSLDAVSASNMRHVVKGAGNISRAVLAEIEGGNDG